jgi:hypothetical protein
MSSFDCHWQTIAAEFGTDKGSHTYMVHYERFLGPKASDPINLLEIGIDRGNSLRMWLKLFPNGRIHGLDYRPLESMGWIRCSEWQGWERLNVYLRRFQQDPAIAKMFKPNSLDVIIDDGGHWRNLQRDSVEILWPCLKVGGYYFIEDIVTDVYPDEIDHWKADPDCIFTEANKCDIYGKYERADAIVVLQKRGERPKVPLMTPESERFTVREEPVS